MSVTTLQFTAEELKLLTALTSDQLFRREFIDPKMPGHKSNPTDLTLGKAILARLRAQIEPNPAKKAPVVRHAV